MTLDRERLLELAYRLLEEPGWSDKMSTTAVNTVAGIFREITRLPAETNRLQQTLSLVESLPRSPLARYSMQQQYQRILDILQIRKGQVNHPILKGLGFEELAYVICWMSRLHRSVAAGVAASKAEPPDKQRPKAGASAEKPVKNSRKDADAIDPRWEALRDWPVFKKR